MAKTKISLPWTVWWRKRRPKASILAPVKFYAQWNRISQKIPVHSAALHYLTAAADESRTCLYSGRWVTWLHFIYCQASRAGRISARPTEKVCLAAQTARFAAGLSRNFFSDRLMSLIFLQAVAKQLLSFFLLYRICNVFSTDKRKKVIWQWIDNWIETLCYAPSSIPIFFKYGISGHSNRICDR